MHTVGVMQPNPFDISGPIIQDACSVNITANQSIATGAGDVFISYDEAAVNNAGMWSKTDPTVVTIKRTGLYSFSTSGQWDGNTTGIRQTLLRVRVLGAPALTYALTRTIQRLNSNTEVGGNVNWIGGLLLPLTSGSRLGLEVFQNSGVALLLIEQGQRTGFSVLRVSD